MAYDTGCGKSPSAQKPSLLERKFEYVQVSYRCNPELPKFVFPDPSLGKKYEALSNELDAQAQRDLESFLGNDSQ